MMLHWLAILSYAHLSVAEIDVRSTLREFYEATGGNSWKNNFGWAENLEDICDWYGVVCEDNKYASIVFGLNLENNLVRGRNPSSLWNLPELEVVNFSGNTQFDVNFVGLHVKDSALREARLADTATTSIFGITGAAESLELLHMSKNQLNSEIPHDLYTLTQLTSLQLDRCGLLGSLPEEIGSLDMLQELSLFYNGLTGALPESMSELVHMRHLTLSFNQFHGKIPAFVNEYTLLEQLWAINNDFTGEIPSLFQSRYIHKVYLTGNSFGGQIPLDFIHAALEGDERHDISIDLSRNELGGVLPESLDDLESLKINWFLGDNEWTDVPVSLCDNDKWNDGAIKEFECNGLLCPPGTFNHNGFQSLEKDCQKCSSSEYWGATSCYDKDDRSVLVELYVGLDGEKWNRNDNWGSSKNVCDWFGVTCWSTSDKKDGRVRKIQLANNNLEGEIPDTIWSLKHLTTLEFNNNNIMLPFTGIGESKYIQSINIAGTKTMDFDGIEEANDFLKELYADQVSISGSIPLELLQLADIEVLSLQECDLSGEIPDAIFDLVGIKELYLSDNNLKGYMPDRWEELKKLEILALGKNKLKGPLPASFDRASNLRAISLQDQTTKGGGLSGAVHAFEETTTVRTLLLANNKLEGDLPVNFLQSIDGDLPVTVDLSANLITGKVYGTWSRFSRLNLYLEGNFISEVEHHLCRKDDWMSGSVGSFGCDAILCPAGTAGGRRQFIGSICEACGKSDAENAYLGQTACGNDITYEVSERNVLELLFDRCGGLGWQVHTDWKTDKSICKWYGIGCDESGSITAIELGGNQLMGSLPTEIYLLPNLRRLKVHSNALYIGFEGIEKARNLETLSLDSTGLDSLKGIGEARSLVKLTTSSNGLISVPEELSRLINLQTLDLSHNNLNGNLPSWIRNLASLVTLSASHNQFSGPLHDFATFERLSFLGLSNNQLTGSLPSNLLASVSGDQSVVVDLSANKLSGKIPRELSRLSMLSLQVENNQISDIDSELCEADSWNDNDVKEFGCAGILCPSGTWNSLGRQSSEDIPCAPCGRATYLGATHCGTSAGVTSFQLGGGFFLSSVITIVATYLTTS
jgi:Leucine-rich repeat (LRR) protein